jgi:uncharacterized protein (DUF362 family)
VAGTAPAGVEAEPRGDRERPGLAVVASGSSSPAKLLGQVVRSAGLWKRLASARRRSGRSPSRFRIAILPDVSTQERTGIATSPGLVEQLIDLLADHGFEGATVMAGAEVPGYQGVTPRGRRYRVADPSQDLAASGFPPGNVLAGLPISRGWTEASFRIVFGRSRTHVEHGYALCLHALLGVLPLRDTLYHYRQRQKPWDLCLELLRHAPVGFSLIDAWQTADGLGLSAAQHQETRTLLAGDDLLLVDWAGAVKMGIDPGASRVNAHALQALGLPAQRRILGDLTPWSGLRTVHPLVADSFRQALESGEPARLVPGASSPVTWNGGPTAERIAALLSRLTAAAPDNPAALAALASGNFALASAGSWLQAWRTLAAKDELLREEVPLGFDLATRGPSDYEAVEGYLLPLEKLLQATPPDASGVRWRYLDGSVLLEYGELLPVPFPAFVAKVEISTAIQCMKDYLGGCRVPVARDGAGRVVHQAERTRYLPQPNWMVLYGGQPIDVGKLEVIRYRPKVQRIFWRTIESQNRSAEHDDGIVTFAAEPSGTRVTVLVRQKFSLPPFWQAMKLELFPEVKDALVAREYLAYFRETVTNFQMRYEGRDFRVGRPGRTDDSPPDPIADTLGSVARAARSTGNALRLLLRKASGTPATPPPSVDANGFSHFEPAPDEPGVGSRRDRVLRDVVAQAIRSGRSGKSFLTELAAAIRSDLDGREG